MNLDQITKTVVKINTAAGCGSGFYLRVNNLIVTNHHVVEGARRVGIETTAGETIAAHVLMVNPLCDLAFLEPTKVLSLPEVTLKKAASVKNSDRVSVLGYPLGMPFTITEGIVSSIHQMVEGRPYIQTDAPVNPGNSGGPLVNDRGEIIGVTAAKFSNAENIGFAIPIDTVISELESLEKSGTREFAVKCPSCSLLLYHSEEFCPNCGVRLDVDLLFSEKSNPPFATFVEEVFRDLAIDPVIARKGPNYWEFYHGSAFIQYNIYHSSYFYASSPLGKLPKTGLDALYTWILSDPVRPYHLGIYQNTIMLCYRVHLSDIRGPSAHLIQKNLAGLARKADELDNVLLERFGCEPAEFSKLGKMAAGLEPSQQ